MKFGLLAILLFFVFAGVTCDSNGQIIYVGQKDGPAFALSGESPRKAYELVISDQVRHDYPNRELTSVSVRVQINSGDADERLVAQLGTEPASQVEQVFTGESLTITLIALCIPGSAYSSTSESEPCRLPLEIESKNGEELAGDFSVTAALSVYRGASPPKVAADELPIEITEIP